MPTNAARESIPSNGGPSVQEFLSEVKALGSVVEKMQPVLLQRHFKAERAEAIVRQIDALRWQMDRFRQTVRSLVTPKSRVVEADLTLQNMARGGEPGKWAKS